MDVFTHFLLPYAGALAALGLWRRAGDDRDPSKGLWQHRMALAAIFGIAGAAPDLDSLTAWARHTEGLHFLQHRGFSHSLVGAPLHALLAAGLTGLVAKLWRRAAWLRWRRGFVPAAILGSLSHLALDGLTYGGVPLAWPFSSHRYTLDLFGWLVIWLAPLSALAILIHTMGRLPTRRVVQAGLLVLVLLVGTAGARLAEMPDTQPGESRYPRSSHLEWMVLAPASNGTWTVQMHQSGALSSDKVAYADAVPPNAQHAVERARQTDAYRGFRLSTFGPVVTEASPLPANGTQAWEITFTAVVPHFDATHGARWTPAKPMETWGRMVAHVQGDDVAVEQWGW